MIPFAGYGFNKSHAAAYSVVAYRTGWLKCHYPAEFMAANLTNEITSTDGLPEYIAEARRMGIPVDPPDINRSDSDFDVVDGHIVFGFRGINGMGTAAAEAIVAERKANGEYKSFIDFLERVNGPTINKKAIAGFIKTGAFDSLGQNRPTLLQNLEAAMRYTAAKAESAGLGQMGLFEEAGEKDFEDFKFEEAADWAKMEKLNVEKELIGCYVSGHPLDDWRDVIEKCSTCSSRTIDRCAKTAKAEIDAKAGQKVRGSKMSDTVYTAIGMIKDLKPYTTKKGTEMAWAVMQDFTGEFDVTFFPSTWEKVKDKIQNEQVYALKGKVDPPNERNEHPSFLADELLDITSIKTASIGELHILLENKIESARDLVPIKDILFDTSGSCVVYFHIDTASGEFIVKANAQMKAPSSEEFITRLKDAPLVSDVWTA